jgi:hypothetical protein
MAKHPRYHLRFQIIPGPNVLRDARTLAEFCKLHGVEEVVLFFAAEEWNDGLLSRRDEDRWFRTVKKAKRVLDAAGLTVSLNPWATVLHGERGRRFPSDRKFAPAVSPTGEVSKGVASFADPAWRRYIRDQCARFAKLGFRVIWIEDDFRYHNHSPLTWGSGFEPGMLALFSKTVGRQVGRQGLVKKILRPGKPHPWREKWLATWCKCQLDTAAELARDVSKASPCPVKLGLMSTGLDTHSMEGRRWNKLFAALSIDGQVAHRPHFAGFGIVIGRELCRNMAMVDMQRDVIPPRCEVAPEIENYPFTQWAKADGRTWAQMAICQFLGASALLLDLFPFSGNPANQEPEIGRLLDRSRPALQWIGSRFGSSLPTAGVGVPFRQDAADRVRTALGKSMDELWVRPLDPCEYLTRYGIPVSMRRQAVNAIFGPLAWAFDDEEILSILAGGLLLDGESADILCRRGFSQHLGVKVESILSRDDSNYSVEMVTRPGLGVAKGLCFSVNTVARMGVLRPLRGAREWSSVLTPESKRIGPAMVAFGNKLGGRVMTLAACNPGSSLPRSFQRQALAHRAVQYLGGGRFGSPLVTGAAHLLPLQFRGPQSEYLVVFNESGDPARPIINIPRRLKNGPKATLLAPLSKPVPAPIDVERSAHKTVVRARADLPNLGCLVVEW